MHAYHVYLKPLDALTTSAREEVDSEAFDLETLALEPEPDMAESEALSEEDSIHTSLYMYTHAALASSPGPVLLKLRGGGGGGGGGKQGLVDIHV